MAFKGVQVIFTPPYSSQFNSIERCWALIKRRWSKLMSTRTNYNVAMTVADLKRISWETGRTFTADMLTSNQAAIDKCLAGELV